MIAFGCHLLNLTTSPPLLCLRSVCKQYCVGNIVVNALRNITLSIKQGEYLSIVGKSGSGKSTLVNLIGCLDRPSSGSVLLEGQDLNALDDQALSLIRADRIGHIFQNFNLIPYLSVIDNVALPFTYNHRLTTNGAILSQVEQAVRSVGLGHRMTHRPSQLSGGEMQRVAIARALVIEPAIIIADEPTGNLDSTTGAQIMALLEKVHCEGGTVILITHDTQIAQRTMRRLVLRDGSVVED